MAQSTQEMLEVIKGPHVYENGEYRALTPEEIKQFEAPKVEETKKKSK